MDYAQTIHDTDQTPEQLLARIEAEAAALRAKIAASKAALRPNALAHVLASITEHGFTKAELDPALRKRPFAPKPRKAALAAVGGTATKAAA